MIRNDKAAVRLVRAADGWRLLRGGRPYFVKGAGGSARLDLLAASGGNSIRTWGADKLDKDLAAARAHGLTVTAGIWLGHKGHGFRYDDPAQVKKQFEQAREYVLRHRAAPNLLLWAAGNEMEGDGKDPAVWRAVEEIARMMKELDPAHPTMTVIADIGENGIKPKQIAAFCPSIDILGVNSYGGLASLPERLRAAGWTKPYIVTEFGPPGPWEVAKTAWGAPREPSSTEKALAYAESYRRSIGGQPGRCLGSYVFLWGDKVEATPTWFGMFVPGSGERLATVDAMAAAWGGRRPSRPAPVIRALSADAPGDTAAPGASLSVTLAASGAGPLRVAWEVRPEQDDHENHEPGQKPRPEVRGVVPPPGPYAAGKPVPVTAPTRPGPYRLYALLRDSHGGAATANLPFLVRG